MKKYIALIASIILVIPFFFLVICAIGYISDSGEFDETALGNLLKD